MNSLINNHRGVFAFSRRLIIGKALLLASFTAFANHHEAVDCPLRDVAYSVDLPFIEIMLKPEALAVVNRHANGMVDNLPESRMRTETPSFGTITTLERVAQGENVSADVLQRIDADLAQLEITDADRQARCARYSNETPAFEFGDNEKNLLVFHKINGFDHGPSVTAATKAVQSLGEQMGWGVYVTDKPGVFNPEMLSQFDVVVWNNNSGDVLTLSQREAFENYINSGGAYLGIHGAGGDYLYLWEWYANRMLGARFSGHPGGEYHFQDAQVQVEDHAGNVAASLAPGWTMKEEWYSFDRNPRDGGADVIATLDEATYVPGNNRDVSLSMGDDHPIVWTQCVGNGRSMYTAIGHRPEVYGIPENLILLRDGLNWLANQGTTECASE